MEFNWYIIQHYTVHHTGMIRNELPTFVPSFRDLVNSDPVPVTEHTTNCVTMVYCKENLTRLTRRYVIDAIASALFVKAGG
ncbi:hypothetical protein HanXRQr2_Chr15g0698611 [Helianthus annuus]|uniref:Uncharacterized protein n=1 Tax=Helianthus annuus TaxID=4232 RepID=A0A9K3E2T2_HELAN|nr:hypothetical protein HanXRQr2_Chr15g0698611 [Helianthus annuus]KAJ0831715.1 hypothetical protein HanPSC8_Chr15g0670281 [Helianthus annuus]